MQFLLFSTPVTDRLLRHYLFSTNWNIATFIFKMCKVEIAVRLKIYITNLCLQQIFTVKLSKAYNLNTDRLFITATNVRISGRSFFEVLLNSEDLLLSSLVFNSLITYTTNYTGNSKLELLCLGCAPIRLSISPLIVFYLKKSWN